jgi:uncharacterized repeat protein (TIGR03803 family)
MEKFIFQIFSQAHAFLISFFRSAQPCLQIKKLIIFGWLMLPAFCYSQTALFGLTSYGNYGATLFSTDANGRNAVVRYNFRGDNGAAYPSGKLIQASNGKIYGMTYAGGTNDQGTIYEFDPETKSVTTRYNFGSIGADGSSPWGASLTDANNGKLYGIIANGGIYGTGMMFEFDPVSTSYNKVRDFSFNDSIGCFGGYPQGSLLYATNGKLYGLTARSSSPQRGGSLFQFDPDNNTFKVIKRFRATNIVDGSFDLTQTPDGKIYGVSKSPTITGGIVLIMTRQQKYLHKELLYLVHY